MTRRSFFLGAAAAATHAAETQRSIAITMDDLNWMPLPNPTEINTRLLAAMRSHQARLALFVIGRNADSATGQALIQPWKQAGHLIGNHTFAHRNYDSLTFEEFSADVIRADQVLASDLSMPRLFRFPALKEGNTAAKRDRMREFLVTHRYRNGYVTIDASDWYYDNRLRQRLATHAAFDVNRFRQPYLDHLWERAQFYDDLSMQVLSRSVPHTLLIHWNLLNSLFLTDVLNMFHRHGWRIVSAEHAFRDPVFLRAPKTVPAGESLLWALAKETGKFEDILRYPGEDDVYEKPKLDRLGL
ncbi:MAG TPA: polysaccharide deacetylase family protein [Bryobacteraceae bacterium]|nr:polysaccharide deacetylase family protein [Bryobacteraceae bacterium]